MASIGLTGNSKAYPAGDVAVRDLPLEIRRGSGVVVQRRIAAGRASGAIKCDQG